MKIDVQMQGVAEAMKKIKDYEVEKLDEVKEIVAASAVTIESNAIARTPVDTGNLKGSINTRIYDDGLSASIGTPIEYAPYVEYGTRRAKAQPFLFPSFEAEIPRYLADIKKALGDVK